MNTPPPSPTSAKRHESDLPWGPQHIALHRSCVKAGYFQDEYVHLFVRRGATKRSPLINRGVILCTDCTEGHATL
jgi:hypothetical protein